MASQTNSEALLLAVMNSSPMVDGVMVDHLSDPSLAPQMVRALGGDGLGPQVERLKAARNSLQDVVRGRAPMGALGEFLSPVVSRASISHEVIEWELDGPSGDLPAARLVLAWSELAKQMPGRLRACANPECTKFLIDHSKPNSARWCSMATCGNRLKARRHKERATAAQ